MSNVTPIRVIPIKNPVHPKVGAAARVAGAVAAGFTILSAVGVVLPADLQTAVTTVAVDVALAVPVVVAYLKRA